MPDYFSKLVKRVATSLLATCAQCERGLRVEVEGPVVMKIYLERVEAFFLPCPT
jgi:hypothetical protein